MEGLTGNSQDLAARLETEAAEIEIVVPFTTPELTRAALRQAERLSHGLAACVRLIKVQIAPFPLESSRSPVSLHFLNEQLSALECLLPVKIEILLARDYGSALQSRLRPESLTVLASKRRPWKTSQERLADRLKQSGHEVVVSYLEAIDA